jgi:hypothetical protein
LASIIFCAIIATGYSKDSDCREWDDAGLEKEKAGRVDGFTGLFDYQVFSKDLKTFEV